MKAILILDVPEELVDKIGTKLRIVGEEYNVDWKLKPLPKKKNEEQYQDFGNGTSMYWTSEVINQNKGYNACLDEITGETE